MTNFDDISFMMAYRFLEANGRKYTLGEVEILHTDDELSDLKKKYDAETAGAGVGAHWVLYFSAIILLPVYIPQVFEIKDPIIAFCFNAIMGFFYIFL